MLFAVPQVVTHNPALPNPDTDIIFLSSFEGLEGQMTAVDRSPLHASMLFHGNATLSEDHPKFGRTSLKIVPASGVNTGVRTDANVAYTDLVVGDFTIEAFVYITGNMPSQSPIAAVAGNFASSAQSRWQFMFSGNNQLRFTLLNNPSWGGVVYADFAFQLNTMYHVACCKFRNIIRIFVNGVMMGSGEMIPTLAPTSTIGLSIGCDWDFSNYVYNIPGYLDEVRITRGAWYRYDTGFTPPTGPFGVILPGLHVDTDTFYAARSSPYGLQPQRVIDTDTFYAPSISPRFASAPYWNDAVLDTFPSPTVGTALTWTSNAGGATISGTNNVVATGAGGTAQQLVYISHNGLVGNLQYWEYTATDATNTPQYYGIGMVSLGADISSFITGAYGGILYYANGHVKSDGTDLGAIMPAIATGDVIAVALDKLRDRIWFKKVSGTPGYWNNNPLADPVLVIGGLPLSIAGGININRAACTFGGTGGITSNVVTANFGRSSFTGAAPTGYVGGFIGR